MGYSNCILKEAKVDFTECICSFVDSVYVTI